MLGIGSVVSGKYRLVRLLGDGGMGSVYEAQHSGLGTLVAIKVLHPELARRAGLVERFLQEARVAAQIRNPHVVQVTDVDRTADGQAYIVMELLEGEPLSSVLDRQQKLPIPTACEYTHQILSALEAAHALGVIHRDLKPENVFLTFAGGKPVLKLIDFGIAKARRTDPRQKSLTVAGVIMGTAEYMAPEQARSADKVDARADVYAAGVMLYEMIAGSRPASGDDAHVIALKVERGDVVPLVQVAPEVPRELAGLVHRAMAPRPELRFASATEMRLALEKARRSGTAAMAAVAGAERVSISAVPSNRTVGMPKDLAHASTGAQSQVAPSVHTLRAPPIATALAPPAYGGGAQAYSGAVPPGYGGAAPPPAPAVHPRRRGGGGVLALVAVPLLLGAGVVGLLVATGTWASSPAPARAPVSSAVDEDESEEAPASARPVAPGAAPAQTARTSDVPTLLPTRPTFPRALPRPLPSGRSTAPAASDAGSAPPPFFLPSTFPSALPPFPSTLPFPTSFPSAFPSVLPPWPPAP